MDTVKLIEVFNTWQGEGPDAGRPMVILRFKLCNRKCKWCDTQVKMRVCQEAEYPITQIQKIIDETKAGILITGGEPTFKPNYDQTVSLLQDLKYPVANVETNGYNLLNLVGDTHNIVEDNQNIKFCYSPKIFNESDLDEAKYVSGGLFANPSVYFKVVYEKENQILLDAYLDFITKNTTITKQHRLYLMPEGVTRVDLLRNAPMVFDACEKYRSCFSTRMHIMYEFV